MKDKIFIKNWQQVLFYGSIWGILEATIGYVLHLMPALISGSIMFPVASLIMAIAYKQTKDRSVVMNMAALACAIKLVNLFVPGAMAIKVINPSIAIVIEGFAVALVMPYIFSKKKLQLPITALGASIGWKAVFVLIMFGESYITGIVPTYLQSFDALFQFVIVTGGLSAILTFAFLWIVKRMEVFSGKVQPAWMGGIACLLALVTTLIL